MRSSDWSSDVCSSDLQQAFPTGSIVRLSPVPVEVRDVDRTVAHVAAHHQGRYSVDLHLAQDPMMTQDRAEMHVRRLEAMRRLIGEPDRQPDGSWVVDQDNMANADSNEREKSRTMPARNVTTSARLDEKTPQRRGATRTERNRKR